VSFERDVDVALAAAGVGAAVVRRRFGSVLRRVEKGGGDFATSADVEAETAMVALLRRERPEDAILGEETGRSGPEAGVRTWLIDPLCGTHNYAAGMRMVAVNVALEASGRIAVAAAADPFADEIFWTDGAAAWKRASDHDAPLAPDPSCRLVELNFDPPFPSARTFRATALAAQSEFARRFRPRVTSTSLALAWVAAGRRAAYVTDGDVRRSVHFAAGLALCEAAGCTLTDLRGQAWGRGATGLVAAADTETHARLLQMVRQVGAPPAGPVP
jgi:myo-inositol-1(or 4)-monophosphatase